MYTVTGYNFHGQTVQGPVTDLGGKWAKAVAVIMVDQGAVYAQVTEAFTGNLVATVDDGYVDQEEAEAAKMQEGN